MKKNKPVIVECRYTGNLPFPSWKKWKKWSSYRDAKTAQMAVDNLNGKGDCHEYRIRPAKVVRAISA